jgi:hypothetical protein
MNRWHRAFSGSITFRDLQVNRFCGTNVHFQHERTRMTKVHQCPCSPFQGIPRLQNTRRLHVGETWHFRNNVFCHVKGTPFISHKQEWRVIIIRIIRICKLSREYAIWKPSAIWLWGFLFIVMVVRLRVYSNSGCLYNVLIHFCHITQVQTPRVQSSLRNNTKVPCVHFPVGKWFLVCIMNLYKHGWYCLLRWAHWVAVPWRR